MKNSHGESTPYRTDRFGEGVEMAKGNVSGRSCINEFLQHKSKKVKEETVRKYANELYRINSTLRENGMETNPRRISEDDVRFVIEKWSNLKIGTKDWYLEIFNRYLKYFKNDVIKEMNIFFGHDERPNADWLSDEEYVTLLNADLSPLEEIVIHLELFLGLRVSEVTKLRVCDIHFDNDPKKQYISVLGKGRGEGKWRQIRFHPESRRVFERWLEKRKEIVDKVKRYDRSWVVPDNVLLWCHYNEKPKAGFYTEQGHSIDRAVIHTVRERYGMHFGNHTLRRTFGRKLYHAGVPIETISAMYGHEDIATTIRYLGIGLDDMGDAFDRMYIYQAGLAPKFRRE